MIPRRRCFLFCMALSWLPPLAQAAAIPGAYQRVSRAFGLPSGLLYAMAIIESARPGPDGRVQPWPWTLNVAGAPHYYPTRSAACHALRALIDGGRRNIDIGLMQISWRWHDKQLITPCRGLAPGVNLRVAARLLAYRYRQSGDWWNAAGRYHDPGRDRASIEAAWSYRDRVLDRWRRVATPAKNVRQHLIWIAATAATTSANLIWIAERKALSDPFATVRGE